MPTKMVDYFANEAGVAAATGSLVQGAGALESVQGIDLEGFLRISGGLRYLRGGPFQGPDDIIVDERYASQKRLSVGSPLRGILNQDWRVCGIVESGKLSRLFLPLTRVQELTGNSGRISQVFIKLEDPSKTDETVSRFKANPALQGYGIYSIQEYTSLWSIERVPALKPFIYVVTVVAVLAAFAFVLLSMYTAVLERTREIGILKSLGAQPPYILGLLMRESVILGLCGAALGIVMSFATRWLILTFADPMLVVHIVPAWWAWVTLLSIGGAILGTAYPAWKAVRQDTLEALSYD
jgi:putative ABC transport system permease protein